MVDGKALADGGGRVYVDTCFAVGGFGNCTNTRSCEAECPKNESIANIARLNREFIKAKLAD